jgi:A/G-specific adenine glycosylase
MNRIISSGKKYPPKGNSENSVHPVKVRQLVSLLLKWFSENARDLPWRRTHDPYAIWVSEIMLQQTQVKTVIPYWERWLRELPTILSLAKAPSDKIHKLWEGLGYYTRVRNLQKAAQVIVKKHSGIFPENFDDILELPGVGRYTAGAICSIAFNQPTPILDGNVIRVLTRISGIETDPREKKTNARLWQFAEKLVAHAKAPGSQRKKLALASLAPLCENSCSFLNQSLMELGALACTPRNPKCPACPVQKLCVAFKTNRVEKLPNLTPRVATTARRFAAFIVKNQNQFLVRQRPAGLVNAHLWEFPNVELNNASVNLQTVANLSLGFSPKSVEPLCTIKHSITRYRITLDAFTVHVTRRSGIVQNNEQWLNLSELKKLSFPSAHRKILEKFSRNALSACQRIKPVVS